MKHNPKIHTQIHPSGTFPVHDGVYRVKYYGDWYWCKWKRGLWHFACYGFRDAKYNSFIGDQNVKQWYGLRQKPKGMK